MNDKGLQRPLRGRNDLGVLSGHDILGIKEQGFEIVLRCLKPHQSRDLYMGVSRDTFHELEVIGCLRTMSLLYSLSCTIEVYL